MRYVSSLLFTLIIFGLPAAAFAQSFELSLGSGVARANGETDRIPTNIMATPGLSLAGGIVDIQLGLLADLGDVENSEFDFQIRPQIKFDPPVLPLYLRAIFSITNLRGDGDPVFYYGGGLGFEIPLPLVTPFIEGAVLPTDTDATVVEFRVGVDLL